MFLLQESPQWKMNKIFECIWQQSSRTLVSATIFATNHIKCPNQRAWYLGLGGLAKCIFEIEACLTDKGDSAKVETALVGFLQRAKKFVKHAPDQQKPRCDKAISDAQALLTQALSREWKEVIAKIKDQQAKLKPLALGLENGKCWKSDVKDSGAPGFKLSDSNSRE